MKIAAGLGGSIAVGPISGSVEGKLRINNVLKKVNSDDKVTITYEGQK